MAVKSVSIWNFNNNKKKVGEIRNEEFERGTLPGKHTELGMWLGANLILELLQLNPIKGQGHEEDNKEG